MSFRELSVMSNPTGNKLKGSPNVVFIVSVSGSNIIPCTETGTGFCMYVSAFCNR